MPALEKLAAMLLLQIRRTVDLRDKTKQNESLGIEAD